MSYEYNPFTSKLDKTLGAGDSPTFSGLTISGTGERITGLASGRYLDFNDNAGYTTFSDSIIASSTTSHAIVYVGQSLSLSGSAGLEVWKAMSLWSEPSTIYIHTSGSTGDYAGLLFGVTSLSTSQKGAIYFERLDTNGRGAMLFAINNTADASNTSLADVALTLNQDRTATFASTKVTLTGDAANSAGVFYKVEDTDYTTQNAQMGVLKASDGSYALPGIWFNLGATAPSFTNFNFLHDGTNVIFNVATGGTIPFRVNNITNFKIASGAITIGSGTAGVDYTLTFDGETNDGVINWMEDEDYFRFDDDIYLSKRLYFNPSPAADTTSDGVIVVGTAGENLTYGEVVYIKSDGKYWKASGSSATTIPAVAMALGTINADATGNLLLLGYARKDAWSWTVGGIIYVDPSTAGAITQTIPTGTGKQIQIVGIALTADVVWFRPDLTYAEHL